jgi:DNA repair protein RecO (recombination protein O)
LRNVDYADADRIVTLLTVRFGKAAFIARGARRSKKRFGGVLQPFLLLEVEVNQGAGQLGSLLRAQISRSFPHIVTDLGLMAAGFAALELVRELTAEHEPDHAVFATAIALLEALDTGQLAPQNVLLCFEVRLLSLLGFAPQLDRCGLCGKRPLPAQAAELDPQLGHLVCRSCGGAAYRLSGGARMRLSRATGSDWLSAAELSWPARELATAREALLGFAEQRIGRKLSATALLPVATEEHEP